MATYQDAVLKIRINRLEKERLKELAKLRGFGSLSDFVKHTLANQK